MWRKVKNSHDPDWVEYKTQKMTPSFGRVSLSVWQRSDGCFSASKTRPNFDRAVTVLDATGIDEAKKEAEKWCLQQLHNAVINGAQ